MTETLRILIAEHGRIRGMLSCFETQLDRFGRAERPDYEILGGSMAYCRDYLDRWHHPREDALLDLLQRRAPTQAQACAGLEDQHVDLANATGELAGIFESVQRNAVYPRPGLVERGRGLLENYRRHLDWEEANFFPALAAHLWPEDWREIQPRFAAGDDPLAGNPVDQRYRALFGAIADLRLPEPG